MKFVAINKITFEKYKASIPWLLFIILCLIIINLIFFKTNIDDKQSEINNTIQAVGKLMILPNEVPTVATIVDLDKLKNQIFFHNAKIGDKVLIYKREQKAILYDPSSNKIVELATLSTSSNQSFQLSK